MQNYPVRTSHRVNLAPEALARVLQAHFESVHPQGDGVAASFGAISRIVVRANGRELNVDVTMNPKVSEEVARETIARYNRFLEAATGFNAKERAKRLRKSTSETSTGA